MTFLGENLYEAIEGFSGNDLVRQTAAKILEVLMVVTRRAEGDLMTQEAREYFARLVRRTNEVAPRAPEPARHITPFVLNVWVPDQKRLC
jgi:hypothetical protein